jgi:UDP-glucose 4-epimerase
MPNYFVCGGAGFIGSHLLRKIFSQEKNVRVIVYDNFSSGSMRYLEEIRGNKNLKIIKADIKGLNKLSKAMRGTDIVYHLASNPDIAKAITQPDIDFWEGIYLTNNVLEAMRKNNIKKLLYASGSGVYGDTGTFEVSEEYAPMVPISTYGASKLSCEALISAYCHMFGVDACSFRFANVVGPAQTHGVGLDFIKKLMKNPQQLTILGDGKQSKSYIYVDDAINAMRLLENNTPGLFSYYNVATPDYLTVKEIADIVIEVMGLKEVKYEYTGGDRGWKGDVPKVRLNTEKIRNLGWENKYTSRDAMYLSIKALYQEAKKR